MTAEYIDTYYSRTLRGDRHYTPLARTVYTDVCVIGGGLAGLNTALGVIERGKQAVVIEARRIGWGGSGRNGGFVAKGYAASEMSILKSQGVEKAKSLVNMTKNARKLIRDRINTFDIDCGPLKNGVLTVSWRDKAEEIKSYINTLNGNFDLGFEFFGRERVREECKTERYFDGVFSPHDFQFSPLRYVHGLARVITEKGGQVYEDTPAVKIEKTPTGSWDIHTPEGKITARHVVLCCSIYVDGLDRKLAHASFPVKTYVMVTKPIKPDLLKASINTDYAIYDNRFCSDYYRVLPDNRVLWGGRVSLWAHAEKIAPLLLSDMVKVYPQLAGHVEADVAWAGELCYAPHKMPQIGQIEPGYWYNTGYGGHGLSPTTVGGEVVAAAIAANDDDYKLFEPYGLSYAGGRMGRYVAQMVYWSWRARDYLDI